MEHIEETLQSRPVLGLNIHSRSRSPYTERSSPGKSGSGSCGQGKEDQLQADLAFFTPATPKERLPKASLRKNDKPSLT